MTDVIMIPLTKLGESEDNVRRVNRKGDISELSCSIRSHGLLQSLVVRDTGRGKFAVVAGGRRLRALRLLAKAGDIEKNAPIPCRVIGDDDNGTELSLAENVSRLDLPVHEELDAFQRLVDAGEGPEAIAARFGVSPMHVARRLKLARVSPRLIEALKREEATLDQLAALAVVDDHAAQEKAFFDAPDWARTPERLKAQVAQAHVPETDKLARFVGLDEYQAAGAVVSDLFAEIDDGMRFVATQQGFLIAGRAKVAALGVAATKVYPCTGDSRHGRHFADDVAGALCAGRQLKDAVDVAVVRWMGWGIGRKTSDTTGIPLDSLISPASCSPVRLKRTLSSRASAHKPHYVKRPTSGMEQF